MNAHIESLHLDVRSAVQKIDQINEELHNAQPHLSSLQQAIEAVQKLPLEIQEKINYFDDKNFLEKKNQIRQSLIALLENESLSEKELSLNARLKEASVYHELHAISKETESETLETLRTTHIPHIEELLRQDAMVSLQEKMRPGDLLFATVNPMLKDLNDTWLGSQQKANEFVISMNNYVADSICATLKIPESLKSEIVLGGSLKEQKYRIPFEVFVRYAEDNNLSLEEARTAIDSQLKKSLGVESCDMKTANQHACRAIMEDLARRMEERIVTEFGAKSVTEALASKNDKLRKIALLIQRIHTNPSEEYRFLMGSAPYIHDNSHTDTDSFKSLDLCIANATREARRMGAIQRFNEIMVGEQSLSETVTECMEALHTHEQSLPFSQELITQSIIKEEIERLLGSPARITVDNVTYDIFSTIDTVSSQSSLSHLSFVVDGVPDCGSIWIMNPEVQRAIRKSKWKEESLSSISDFETRKKVLALLRIHLSLTNIPDYVRPFTADKVENAAKLHNKKISLLRELDAMKNGAPIEIQKITSAVSLAYQDTKSVETEFDVPFKNSFENAKSFNARASQFSEAHYIFMDVYDMGLMNNIHYQAYMEIAHALGEEEAKRRLGNPGDAITKKMLAIRHTACDEIKKLFNNDEKKFNENCAILLGGDEVIFAIRGGDEGLRNIPESSLKKLKTELKVRIGVTKNYRMPADDTSDRLRMKGHLDILSQTEEVAGTAKEIEEVRVRIEKLLDSFEERKHQNESEIFLLRENLRKIFPENMLKNTPPPANRETLSETLKILGIDNFILYAAQNTTDTPASPKITFSRYGQHSDEFAIAPYDVYKQIVRTVETILSASK